MSPYDNVPLFAKDEYGNEVVLDFCGYLEKKKGDTIKIILEVPKNNATRALEEIEKAILKAGIKFSFGYTE